MANKPPISITGSNQETKVRSDDDDVMIGAFDCRVHIEGRMNRLEIRGNDNEVGVAGDLRDLQVKGHNAVVHVVGNIDNGVVTGRNAVVRSTGNVSQIQVEGVNCIVVRADSKVSRSSAANGRRGGFNANVSDRGRRGGPGARAAPPPTANRRNASPKSAVLEGLRNGSYLESNNPEAAARIKSLSWIADGINESEVAGGQHLVDLAVFHPEVFQRVMNLPWVQTLHTIYESYVLASIFTVARTDTQAACDIAGMPFLRSVESWDVQAMKSICQMLAFDLSTFQRVMSHPTLRGGITDDWAKIVATLYGVGRNNPDLINKLLDSAHVRLEQREIAAPLSGQIQLAIIRTAPGTSRSMDLLEQAVRYVEGYMGDPIQVAYVAVLFENAVSRTAAGTNSGTHITVLPKYDIDDGSPESDFTAQYLVHEVGHYYWTGNANWIDEGACNLLGSCFERARTGEPIHPSHGPSMPARNIRELEQHPEYGNAGFTCNYALGERIFMDLHRSLGAKEFRLGFQHLWRASAIAQGTINLNGSAAGISQLYSAFALAGDAETVDRVVGRWYHGSAGDDTRYLDTSPVDPRLPSINGRIDAAFMSTASKGPEINQFSSALVNDFVWLNLRYSYRLAAGSRVVPLDIVEYYEDGFVFHRRNWRLIAESRYTGGTTGVGVGRAAPARWAPGRYLVYVYESDRKVAQVEFTVTP